MLLASFFTEPVTALAWGVFFGGVGQLLFLLFFSWKIQLMPKPKLSGDKTGVTRILKNMLPAIFGVSVAQINVLFETIFGSYLPKGSISWLYYSDRIMEFPMGVFGVALATVVLPHLSREHAKNNQKDFIHTVDWSLQLIVLIGLPAALGIMILAEPLLITLFNYGKFTVFDVHKTSMSLQVFSCGLISLVSVKILASANYARRDIRTPVKIAALCMVINMVLSFTLMQYFYHVGLAMASIITSFINASLLLFNLVRRGVYKPVLHWRPFLVKVLLANLIWVTLVLLFTPEISTWLAWGRLQRMGSFMTLMGSVMVVYFLSLRILGFNLKKQLSLN